MVKKLCQDCGMEVKWCLRKGRCLNCYRHWRKETNQNPETAILNRLKKRRTSYKPSFDDELRELLGYQLYEDIMARFK